MIERLLEWLRRYRVVLVSGPQRSGTRIAAKVLASELNYVYVDENEIYVDSLNALCSALKTDTCKVIQCPALARYVHLLASHRVAVIFMMRNIHDVVASQKRIAWKSAYPELLRYDKTAGEPAEIKYEAWSRTGLLTLHCFELEYTDLRGHPMWIDKEHRKDFGPLQTTNDDSNHSSDTE